MCCKQKKSQLQKSWDFCLNLQEVNRYLYYPKAALLKPVITKSLSKVLA